MPYKLSPTVLIGKISAVIGGISVIMAVLWSGGLDSLF